MNLCFQTVTGFGEPLCLGRLSYWLFNAAHIIQVGTNTYDHSNRYSMKNYYNIIIVIYKSMAKFKGWLPK